MCASFLLHPYYYPLLASKHINRQVRYLANQVPAVNSYSWPEPPALLFGDVLQPSFGQLQ